MLVATLGLPVRAAGPTAEESSAKLDGIIETLKKEAVDFNREAQDVEQAVMHPEHSRVTVYVSCNVSRLLLQNVTVTIDDGKPVRYDYSERSAKALLLSDGLHRIVLADLEPGVHRIRAEFRGQFADADSDDPPVFERFEQTFEKGRKALDLELKVARTTRLSPPRMSLVVWKKASETADKAPQAAAPTPGQRRRTPTS